MCYSEGMNKTATKGYKMETSNDRRVKLYEMTVQELMDIAETLPAHLVEFAKEQLLRQKLEEMINNNKN
jgi:hypothetical protein